MLNIAGFETLPSGSKTVRAGLPGALMKAAGTNAVGNPLVEAGGREPPAHRSGTPKAVTARIGSHRSDRFDPPKTIYN
jgi:hypothetical protein